MDPLRNLASMQECCDSPKQVMSPSVLENLIRRKTQLEDSLARVNAAIEALQENPQVSKVLELLAKANY